MCQAFEGERAFYLSLERSARKRGYDAFIAGKDQPDESESFKEDWQIGYNIAKNDWRLF